MRGLTNDVRRFWWVVLAIALLTIVTRLPSLLLPRLLAERYRPVAWTAEGVIYQMNSSRGVSEKSVGAQNNRSD
jgi:hypothetical protein